MSSPTVSVCLPNLNNCRYLEERFESILEQTFDDWELVVVDNHSDDGAWEIIEQWPRRDRRVRAWQAPRAGMYANWNNCVRAARGKYVYIATSDDTMAENCLEALVDALERRPECGIAHCNLRTIDSNGEELEFPWYQNAPFVLSSGNLVGRSHVRLAPFDGLLHLMRKSVYVSITQLLFRRSLFDEVGPFESKWGSMGDFNWNMRAALVANTVHVANTWGGWRLHPAQATAQVLSPTEYWGRIDAMISHAISASLHRVNEPTRRVLSDGWGSYLRDREEWWYNGRQNQWERVKFVLNALVSGRRAAWDYYSYRLGLANKWEVPALEVIQGLADQCGVRSPLVLDSSSLAL